MLEKHFCAEEAEHQLDIIIDWGRYAELISYDEKVEVLYLEKETDEAANE